MASRASFSRCSLYQKQEPIGIWAWRSARLYCNISSLHLSYIVHIYVLTCWEKFPSYSIIGFLCDQIVLFTRWNLQRCAKLIIGYTIGIYLNFFSSSVENNARAAWTSQLFLKREGRDHTWKNHMFEGLQADVSVSLPYGNRCMHIAVRWRKIEIKNRLYRSFNAGR